CAAPRVLCVVDNAPHEARVEAVVIEGDLGHEVCACGGGECVDHDVLVGIVEGLEQEIEVEGTPEYRRRVEDVDNVRVEGLEAPFHRLAHGMWQREDVGVVDGRDHSVVDGVDALHEFVKEGGVAIGGSVNRLVAVRADGGQPSLYEDGDAGVEAAELDAPREPVTLWAVQDLVKRLVALQLVETMHDQHDDTMRGHRSEQQPQGGDAVVVGVMEVLEHHEQGCVGGGAFEVSHHGSRSLALD